MYHRLHQLHLVHGKGQPGGLMLALSAMNMAEAGAGHVEPQLLADIYIAAALRLKQSYSFLQPLAR